MEKGKSHPATSIRRTINVATFAFGVIFLSACSFSGDMYYRFYAVDEGVWHKDSVARFEVFVGDTLSPHDVWLTLRNDNRYPYQNIWLFVSLQNPAGAIRRDTIEYRLADDSGKWYGTGFSLYESTVPYETSVVYPRSGVYVYTVTQAMRDDRLQGINDVGLRIE
jgi:gliding motility-associated lipoprotein GldH